MATGTVICEEPNSQMHHFVGSLEWNSRKYSLGIGNLLLRGCRIHNVDTCYGLVIYTGKVTQRPENAPYGWGGVRQQP
jgi:phospholipid-translocating ATPase